MRRRTYLHLAGAFGVTGLSGCQTTDDGGSGGLGTASPEPSETESPTETTETDDPVATIEAYFDAVSAGDSDALRETVHDESPYVPTIDAGKVTFPDSTPAFDPDTAEIVDSDPTPAEIREFEAAGFVFDDGELDDAFADRSGVLVEAASEPTNLSMGETWVLLRESGRWRVFWVGTRSDVPDDPSEVFDPEIVDTAHDVVAEVDWEYDQDTDGAVSNVEWAQVIMTDTPGIEAETIRVESTIEGWETELSGGDDDEPGGWAGTWANIALHEDGDQIVVTAISDGTETVVHRVHYEPKTESETSTSTGTE
ncbi:hypothetical protein [Haloarcula sediminis]|uniref:hypothetical protein n=1 Tax=Haloarcula sediminis TaxID=3111777 RepID=UPI002D769987|nr:hypothetical protein [Haloarcula sp. CK38]